MTSHNQRLQVQRRRRSRRLRLRRRRDDAGESADQDRELERQDEAGHHQEPAVQAQHHLTEGCAVSRTQSS